MINNQTTFQTKNILRENFLEITENLLEKYQKAEVLLTEDFYTVQKNSLQFLSKLIKAKNQTESIFFRIFGKTLYSSETLSGGSGVIGFVFFLVFFQELLKRQDLLDASNVLFLEKQLQEILEKTKSSIEMFSKVPSIKDLEDIISNICQDDVLTEVVMETLKISGIDGRIYLEDSAQPNFTIEKKSGYSFKAKPVSVFLETQKTITEKNVKVLLVDGVIERVSEIDNILRGAFENKVSVMFVARGFSEEVLATLKHNFDKQLLRIIPVLISADLQSINLLNDIAAVCNTDFVSVLKGDMLCFQNIDSLSTVETIHYFQNQITIEENSSKNKVALQLQNLINKRQNETIEDIIELLDERIKSLTGDVVYIRLPNTTSTENLTQRAKLDICFRTAKSVLNNNIIDFDDVSNNISKTLTESTPLESAFKNSLLRIGKILKGTCSSLSLYLALKQISSQVLLLATSSGIVVIDQEE